MLNNLRLLANKNIKERKIPMLDNLVNRLINGKIATREQIKGCSEKDIEELEKEFKLKLPNAYKTFLKLIGLGGGKFWSSERFHYRQLFLIPKIVENIIRDEDLKNVLVELPADTFVFLVHHDYEFFFFCTNEGEDPPVYYYLEHETQYVKFADSFSLFIDEQLRETEYAYRPKQSNS
jgi:hypothetical protein